MCQANSSGYLMGKRREKNRGRRKTPMSQAGCRKHAECLVSLPDHSPAQRLRHLDFLAIHLQVLELSEVLFFQAVENLSGVAAYERHPEGHRMENHAITGWPGLEGALRTACSHPPAVGGTPRPAPGGPGSRCPGAPARTCGSR